MMFLAVVARTKLLIDWPICILLLKGTKIALRASSRSYIIISKTRHLQDEKQRNAKICMTKRQSEQTYKKKLNIIKFNKHIIKKHDFVFRMCREATIQSAAMKLPTRRRSTIKLAKLFEM
jgi:hypothetical protein